MNDGGSAIDDRTLSFGLLMESAQAHQKLAEGQLQKLRDHTRDLDGVVRDEIRRTLVDELQTLTAETARTIGALKTVQRRVMLRHTAVSVALAMGCALAPVVVAKLLLPTPAAISSLTAQRDAMALNISRLRQRGGAIELRRCGAALRLCVQVDVTAPRFGDKADYYIMAGY